MSQLSKVVVITGASSGIGRATARRYAAEGWSVGLIARTQEALDEAVREIEQAGGRGHAVACDVADAEAVDRAHQDIENALGPVDVWINAAMVTVYSPLSEMTPEEFRRVTEVTYLGTVHGTISALRRMRARGQGRIIQVGSALAYRGIPLQSAYCGAKHAMKGFTESVRCELLHDDSPVQITMVQLGAFNTPQFERDRTHMAHQPQPLPPIFQPEIAADVIWDAAQRYRREWYVGGSVLQTIWGNRLVAGLLDRVLARKAWRGQLTNKPTAPDRPDNLYTPAPGDYGAHGTFDDRARSHSLQVAASRHRGMLATVALAAVGVIGALALWRR